MRRPHPRFDARRNSWVTDAGGKLKSLANGPKNADTEQQAWNAFCEHMARLVRPVDAARPQITLGGLADEVKQRDDVELITVSPGNRDSLPSDLVARFRGC